MAKVVILHEFPETDKSGLEFFDGYKSDVKYKNHFRRIALLCVLLFGVLVVILGTLFLTNKSSSGDKNDTLQNKTTSISDGKILQSNVISVSNTEDGNKTNFANINSLKKQSQTPYEFDTKPEVKSSEEWTSFEDFLQFDRDFDTTEDNSIIFHQSGSTINVNEDCEKSPFDKEFVKTLTQDQISAVERLREKVTSNLMETFCDANSENYLVRWLKYKDWNVDEACRAVFHTLAWRKKEKVDELQTEDFSYFDEAFPVFLDGKDKTGQLVISIDAAIVDPRKIMLVGKGDQMFRYLIRIAETGLNISREAQFRGENVTQGIMIINIQGFNIKQHACDKCITFMYRYINVVEEHYPLAFFKIFLINAPHEFEWMLHLAKSVLPSYMIDAMEIFGTNKQDWQKAILELVPADQLRPQFGGTKADDD